MNANIVLIGPMASGKSTVGAALARRLSRPHVDSDQFFAARHGSIPEYFSTHGEQAFRRAEERIIAELLDAPRPSVVSLGGGAVLSENTCRLLRPNFVVMLEVTREQARARIGDAATRPVLTAGGEEPPIDKWARIYASRRPLYLECADLVVSAAEETIGARVDTIVQAVNARRHRHRDQPTAGRTEGPISSRS